MRRLEAYLCNLCDDPPTPDDINYPEDIAAIKAMVPELAGVSDDFVNVMYADYSSSLWAAGWMFVDEGRVVDFRRWLLADHETDHRCRWGCSLDRARP